MTEIEELWDKAKTDPEHRAVNGSLMKQATYICRRCGHEIEHGTEQCIYCGHTADGEAEPCRPEQQ